jgi:hypothetical protein
VGGCTVGRTALTLAVITVVIGGDEGRVHVDGVRDGFAKAVSGKRHFDSRKVLSFGDLWGGEEELFNSRSPLGNAELRCRSQLLPSPAFLRWWDQVPSTLASYQKLALGSFSRFHKSS